MRHLRVSFELKSSLRTPFQADTIFGHICWAIRHIAGEERLRSFLNAYDGALPLLISDGFPVLDGGTESGTYYLPRPLTPMRSGAVKAVSESLGIAGDEHATSAELDDDDEGGELEKEAFADVHTLDQARAYNFECWIYGSDPKANADIVENGSLPEDRAEGCEEEWDQLTRGWGTLLDPHLR